MKIQTKVILLLAIVTAMFMAGLFYIRHSAQRSQDLYFKERVQEKNAFFDKIVKLKGSSLEMFAFDYTYWDEMVHFLSTTDKTWAHDNIEIVLPTFHSQVAWVYGLDFSLVYSTNTFNDPAFKELPIPKTGFKKLFSHGSFVHFFVNTPRGLLEVRGAPVQPSKDVERKMPPHGFFLVGRLWDNDFIDEISGLTDNRITLLTIGNQTSSTGMYDEKKGIITFTRTLPGWDGRPLSQLYIINESAIVNELNRLSNKQFVLFIVFASSLLAFLFLFLMRWVSVPLQSISKSLEEESPAIIDGLQKEDSELGLLARLIRKFFEQRSELRRRLVMEKAVARVSNILFLEKNADFSEVLAMLCQAAGVSRAFIYQFMEDGRLLYKVSEWRSTVTERTDEGYQGVKAEPLSWLTGRMLADGAVVIPDTSQLSEEARTDQEFFKARGVGSLLAVPIRSAGRLLGFIGFDYTLDQARDWPEEDIRLLVAASEMLGAHFLRKKSEEESLRTSKLESLGVLAGGIAHDFNNILTAVIGNISLGIISTKPEEDLHEVLKSAEKAAYKARDLTQQLLTFSKGGAPIKSTASIAELIRDSVSFARRGSRVLSDISLPDDLMPVEVDEGQISQVIHNLVLNAEQAMPDGGTIEIRAENVSAGPERYVKVTVKDHGVGIPEKNLSKIFDPYFTTKQHGSGLGLASVYFIVKKHGGHISVESRTGLGTEFHIYLPASEKELPAKPACKVCPVRASGRVLVMDDEEIVRDSAGAMLRTLGYKADFSVNSAEAVEMYKKAKDAGQPYDAVIMDLTIPGGKGGKETLKALIEVDPCVKAIVSSGYSNDPVMADYGKYGFSDILAKPYDLNKLADVLKKIITDGRG